MVLRPRTHKRKPFRFRGGARCQSAREENAIWEKTYKGQVQRPR